VRSFFKNNGLSLAMFAFFAVCCTGQSIVGLSTSTTTNALSINSGR